jgi:hypothetical protein
LAIWRRNLLRRLIGYPSWEIWKNRKTGNVEHGVVRRPAEVEPQGGNAEAVPNQQRVAANQVAKHRQREALRPEMGSLGAWRPAWGLLEGLEQPSKKAGNGFLKNRQGKWRR